MFMEKDFRPMNRIALVTSSDSDHTQRIADYMANQLVRLNCEVTTFTVTHESAPTASALKEFDGVILGCPVYLGDLPILLVDWAWFHREQLNSMPSALFTVSLNAADSRPRARAADDRVLRNFIEQTDYRARFVASIGGALEYTQYGFFKRCILQGVSAAIGGPTDTSQDYDLTNWNDVGRFVHAYFNQDMNSDYATINRLPIAPLPSWPMALPRAA